MKLSSIQKNPEIETHPIRYYVIDLLIDLGKCFYRLKDAFTILHRQCKNIHRLAVEQSR